MIDGLKFEEEINQKTAGQQKGSSCKNGKIDRIPSTATARTEVFAWLQTQNKNSETGANMQALLCLKNVQQDLKTMPVSQGPCDHRACRRLGISKNIQV